MRDPEESTIPESTESEWMRETLSDLSNEQLKHWFKSVDRDADCDLGALTRRLLHSAVENYHAERAECEDVTSGFEE